MKKYRAVARQLKAIEQSGGTNPRLQKTLQAAPMIVLFLLLNARSGHASCSFNPSPDPTVDGSPNSLRAAIKEANASGQDCTITLDAGTYTLTIKNTHGHEIRAEQGDLNITGSGHTTTIVGAGSPSTIINANSIDRAFQVGGGANATFENLTIENGLAQDNGTASATPGRTEAEGGGILVQDGGNVTLSNVSLTGNQAIGGHCSAFTCCEFGAALQAAAGGGLFLSSGSVDLADSAISGNSAVGADEKALLGEWRACVDNTAGAGSGGGIFVSAGKIDLTDSTISGNSAVGGLGEKFFFANTGSGTNGGTGGAGSGGGLFARSGSVTLSGSTLSGNNASGGSGGSGGHLTFSSICGFTICAHPVPFAGGSGGQGVGGGLYIMSTSVTVTQSLVSGNNATGGAGMIGGGGTFEGRQLFQGGDGGAAQGAGIFAGSGNIYLTNSTLFANQAQGGSGAGVSSSDGNERSPGGNASGGGLYINSGRLAVAGDTIASNQVLATTVEQSPQGSSTGGGLINAGASTLAVNSTIIGHNSQDSGDPDNGNDVSGAINAGWSIIGDGDGATITGRNHVNVDPLLDSVGLRDNGGPTLTVALESGSPAIGQGDPMVCAAASPKGLGSVDQRGYSRFPDGDQHCDIGAYELNGTPTSTPDSAP